MRFIGVFCAAALLLAGCGVTGEDSEGPQLPPPTPSAVVSDEPTPEPTSVVTDPELGETGVPSESVVEASGADAGPRVETYAMYDPSQAAATNYYNWLAYEMYSSADRGRDFEAEAYPDGVGVCAQLNAGYSIDTIASKLSGTKGWSGTGAAAIIKGAVNSLCRQHNNGYTTYFDSNVTTALNVLAQPQTIPWTNGPPHFYEIGYFAKSVCDYLQTSGSANGLEDFLHSFRVDPQKQATHAGVFINRFSPVGYPPEDRLLRRATSVVVFSVCLGDHGKLNGYWTQA